MPSTSSPRPDRQFGAPSRRAEAALAARAAIPSAARRNPESEWVWGPRKPERPAPALRPREARVLGEIARDADAAVAFQGLRRRLGLHPEQLARTLRRLERDGLLARDGTGYRLTERGHEAAAATPAALPRPSFPLLRAVLPAHLTPEAAAAHFGGRWFHGLRWWGRSHAPGEWTLTWTAEPSGARVRLRLVAGSFLLELEPPEGGAVDLAAGRGLIAALADLLALRRRPAAAAEQPL